MGGSYVRSLVQFPLAREEEWHLIQPFIQPSDKDILDFACGDGFVTSHLLNHYPGRRILGVDSSRVMIEAFSRAHGDAAGVSVVHTNDFVQQRGRNFDLCVCLGGLHHILDQVGVIGSIRDRMRGGGRVVFADFEDASPSQKYFDGLINAHNGFGHIGLFISESRAVNVARACGLELLEYKRSLVHWKFDNKGELLAFLLSHHGLQCSAEVIEREIVSLGMMAQEGGRCAIKHHYATIVLKVAKTVDNDSISEVI